MASVANHCDPRREGARTVALRPRLLPGVPFRGMVSWSYGSVPVMSIRREVRGTMCATVLTADQLQRLASRTPRSKPGLPSLSCTSAISAPPMWHGTADRSDPRGPSYKVAIMRSVR